MKMHYLPKASNTTSCGKESEWTTTNAKRVDCKRCLINIRKAELEHWYCDQCQQAVFQLRCKYCGKSREEES